MAAMIRLDRSREQGLGINLDLCDLDYNVLAKTDVGPCDYSMTLYRALKLKFRKYPSIHTNYTISNSTILQYNHNI